MAVHLLQVGINANQFDVPLQGNNLVVTGHHDHSAELQAPGQVHGADRDVAAGGFDMLIEHLESQPRLVDRCLSAGHLCL